jgi:hypothetical protein
VVQRVDQAAFFQNYIRLPCFFCLNGASQPNRSTSNNYNVKLFHSIISEKNDFENFFFMKLKGKVLCKKNEAVSKVEKWRQPFSFFHIYAAKR